MSKDEEIDLETPRTFNHPNPGTLSAAVRIPEAVRIIAVDLVGKTLPLKDALALLRAADIGEVMVVGQYHYIGLTVKHRGAQHHFRVICYK